jgi:hypothetical protein
MASSGKKKTTMAKLMRESKLRERRATKQARKDDRRRNGPSAVDQSADTSTDSAPIAHAGGQSVDSAVGTRD